ncbi:MAG: hypothetical protein OXC40_06620 [Proteobacteria bacterium]|nr:hypothetical protein [Pseudomonadota bacterium]
MPDKIDTPVIILAGGMSGERDVSLMSADFVEAQLENICQYVGRINISQTGNWEPKHPVPYSHQDHHNHLLRTYGQFLTGKDIDPRDICLFPLLHGSFGEDGCLQGLLAISGLTYVGSGVLGSAIAMNKVVAKQLCQYAGIPTLPWLEVSPEDWENNQNKVLKSCHELIDHQQPLGSPPSWLVKPVSLGSSIGVTRAQTKGELITSISQAFQYDSRIMVEEYLADRMEIESAVLGTPADFSISEPCTVWHNPEINSYHDKYFSDSTLIELASSLSEQSKAKLRTYTSTIFSLFRLFGLYRTDWFYCQSKDQLYFNECNTIPGFGERSHFIRLWELSGKTTHDLFTTLLNLTINQTKQHTFNQLDLAYSHPRAAPKTKVNSHHVAIE